MLAELYQQPLTGCHSLLLGGSDTEITQRPQRHKHAVTRLAAFVTCLSGRIQGMRAISLAACVFYFGFEPGHLFLDPCRMPLSSTPQDIFEPSSYYELCADCEQLLLMEHGDSYPHHDEKTLERSAAKGCLLCRLFYRVFCVEAPRYPGRAVRLYFELREGGILQTNGQNGRRMRVMNVTDFNHANQVFELFDECKYCANCSSAQDSRDVAD